MSVPQPEKGFPCAICPRPRSPQASQEVAGPHRPRDRRYPRGSGGIGGCLSAERLLHQIPAAPVLLQSCLGCSLLTLCLPEPCRGRCPGGSADLGSPQTRGGHPKPWACLPAGARGVKSFKRSCSPKACDGSSCTPVPLIAPVTACYRRAWAGPG
ncbi:unnamed protein product [Coccothraustes coccothraustes]